MLTPIFDLELGRLRKTRIADGFKAYRFLAERCAADIEQRLDAINKDFPTVVNLSSHQGVLNPKTHTNLGGNLYVEGDAVRAMLVEHLAPRCLVHEELVPFADGAVDLFVSVLSLHHINDLPGTLIQLRRALKPDGLLLAAMFGGETLSELRQCLAKAEIDVSGGMGPRVSPFVDVRDAGALLQRAGFALPVVDSDLVTVTYQSVNDLIQDLKGMGQTNILLERSKRPLTRSVLERTEEIYRQLFGNEEGKIQASFEILYLTGWSPHDSQQKPMKPGTAKMRLADALRDTHPHKTKNG